MNKNKVSIVVTRDPHPGMGECIVDATRSFGTLGRLILLSGDG